MSFRSGEASCELIYSIYLYLYVGGRPTFFNVFYVFSDFKKHDFLRFLSCCTRFLEHCCRRDATPTPTLPKPRKYASCAHNGKCNASVCSQSVRHSVSLSYLYAAFLTLMRATRPAYVSTLLSEEGRCTCLQQAARSAVRITAVASRRQPQHCVVM